MPVQPQTRLGRYEIRSLIGKGGMGEVYLAYDSSLRHQVAIKLLPAELTQNRVRLSRFKREASARYAAFDTQKRLLDDPTTSRLHLLL
jgi:serine/threonine protein kinase